jgi:hypothetical protein
MRGMSTSYNVRLGWAWMVLLVLSVTSGRAEIPGTHRAPYTVPDEVYRQETGWQVTTVEPLTAVVVHGGEVYAGGGKGLLHLQGRTLVPDTVLTQAVTRLATVSDRLWAMTTAGLYRRDGTTWTRITTERVTDVCGYRGGVVAAVGNRLWKVVGDGLEEMTTEKARFPIQRLVPHLETLFVQGPGRLAPYAAGRFGGVDAYTWPSDQAWDWGALPSPVTRDGWSVGSAMYLATDRGLGVLRGMSLTVLRGEDGLPFEDTLCLAAGFTNDLWIGTSRGAIRRVGDRFDYFAGRRWVPGERVQSIAVSGDRVYLATDRGLGVIGYEPYTLLKKAMYYERHLEEWGQKRLGFVHKLEWDAPTGQYVREVSDNDGGYSGNYLASQCYRWAVTRDPAARREATNTFHAIRWLEALSGIPGFPARSVWVKGERGHQAGHGSGNHVAEWHDAADGRFEWKGDTSSDEICSHFYAFTLFLDLVAEGEEIAQARTYISRVAGHLVDHGWQLIDVDGKPTRWGRWDPDYFLTDEGKYDRGLQAVELLSFMKTAAVVTGEKRFEEAYARLVGLGYPGYTLRARNTFPPESILHFLDELAFWSYWNLLRLETDPDLRALYRRGYERSHEVVRVERNPWFNHLYGALTGNEAEPVHSVEHLRGWPLDLRVWSYQNSHRSDLRTPPGYVALKGGTRTFPPRETEPLRWDRWLMQADGGAGGNDVVEPGAWLLAYWMGRYHGFIGAPTVTDPGLLTVERTENRELGAKPYEGPMRPY